MRLGCVACVATVLMLVGAAPADAHLIGTNAQPTNYRTSILSVSPPVRGLQVRVAEIGGALELVNRTGQQVVVLGARLEPYLRVEADGRAVWHDRRARWTGPDPPQVRRAPQRRQVVVPRWQVPLRVGDQTAVITGEVVWVPGSSWWPWLTVAAALAALVGASGGTRNWRLVVVVAVTIAIAADLVHTVGAVLASTASVPVRVYASSPSAAGWVLGGLAVDRLLRRPAAESGRYYVLAAGCFFAFAGGLADVTSLGRSQVSTALPVGLTRATVAASLGLGAGMVIVALLLPEPRQRV
jgi:hypothetical protein